VVVQVVEFESSSTVALSARLDVFCPLCPNMPHEVAIRNSSGVCLKCNTPSRDFIRLDDIKTTPLDRPLPSLRLSEDFVKYSAFPNGGTKFQKAFGRAQELSKNTGRYLRIGKSGFSYPVRYLDILFTDGKDDTAVLPTLVKKEGHFEHPAEKKYYQDPLVTVVTGQRRDVNEKALRDVSMNGEYLFFEADRRNIPEAIQTLSLAVNAAVAKTKEVEVENKTTERKWFHLKNSGVWMEPGSVTRFRLAPEEVVEGGHVQLNEGEIKVLEQVRTEEAEAENTPYFSRNKTRAAKFTAMASSAGVPVPVPSRAPAPTRAPAWAPSASAATGTGPSAATGTGPSASGPMDVDSKESFTHMRRTNKRRDFM